MRYYVNQKEPPHHRFNTLALFARLGCFAFPLFLVLLYNDCCDRTINTTLLVGVSVRLWSAVGKRIVVDDAKPNHAG